MANSAIPLSISQSAVASDVCLSIYGDAFVGSKLSAFSIGTELNGKTVDSVKLRSDIGPLGSDLVCDIHKNGVTIFTTQANRPKITAGQTSGVSAVPDISGVVLDDVISIDIDAVGSSIAGGNNLYIIIHFIS